MDTAVIGAIAGALSGSAAAVATYLVGRRESAARVTKVLAEARTLEIQADQAQLELDQARNAAIANVRPSPRPALVHRPRP